MSQAKIVVVGSCNMDIYTWTDHLPAAGETVIGERYWMGMGGKGANQAVGAAALGAQSVMVGRIGQDLFGDRMFSTLQGHGVICDYIHRDADNDSGVALVIVDQHAENVIAVVPGTNMRITPADVDGAAQQIREADVLMMQLEIPLDAIERAIDIAGEGAARIILNPAPARALPERLLGKLHYLTPNQSEARVLTGVSADTIEGAEAAARMLCSYGVEAVVMTLGAEGALVADAAGVRRVPGFVVDSVDTSGAGDAFMAGFGVALAEGLGLDEAVRFANRVGALSTTRPGAMPSMPSRTEVESFHPE